MKNKTLLFLLFALSISFTFSAQESTDNLLKNAQLKAKKEGKAIFIKFEASWCGWCHKMTKDMKAENTKKFFEDNYVIVPIVVLESKGKENLENPGSRALLKKYDGDKAGLPFWLILNKDLEVMTNSYNANNQNLGGPGSVEEVEEFIKKIKLTAKKVTDKDIADIKEQFILKN